VSTSAYRRWHPRLGNLVEDRTGKLWTTDGATPFPIEGFNFARVQKAALGWWVYHHDRWVSFSGAEFKRRF